ncbi:MAG: hypothetical protein JXD22_08050 [Sedimentisphaerales bacterium]|nr:hypothetical protein [Sedimentisphaerales bacterium]
MARKNADPKSKTLALMCPNLRCRKILKVPGSARGGSVRCSYCGISLMVPDSNPFSKENIQAAHRQKQVEQEDPA